MRWCICLKNIALKQHIANQEPDIEYDQNDQHSVDRIGEILMCDDIM